MYGSFGEMLGVNRGVRIDVLRFDMRWALGWMQSSCLDLGCYESLRGCGLPFSSPAGLAFTHLDPSQDDRGHDLLVLFVASLSHHVRDTHE